MKRIGIVAALPGELKPLVEGWHKEGNVNVGRIGSVECIAVHCGMGVDAATHACALATGNGPLDALISIGWAGAISCGIKPPTANVISEVIDDRTGEHYLTASKEGQRLVTFDHVARPNEKRPLAEKHRAPLVDMEAAAVARFARDKGLPFYCFKAVSDGYTDNLPDFNPFIENGQLRMPAFVTYAALHPLYWKSLLQLGQNSREAAVNLAKLITETFGQTL